MQGNQEEMVYQAEINDNDYHVVMGMRGEDRSYENIWRSLKRIFGGRKEEKKTSNALWMGEEKTARENPMGKFGKRLKCLNCFLEKHFIKDCKKERKCYICKKRKDCEENRYFKKKCNEKEGNKEKQFL